MSSQKNIPKLRFPEFRDTGVWEEKKLGEIAALITEKTGNKKYTLMSINAGVGLVSQIEKFGREIAGSSYKNYFVIRENDFAYNKSATKDYPEGFIAMHSSIELAAVPNSIFTCFRTQENKVYPQYLKYLFLCNLHGKWLRQFISVGARAHGSLNIDNKYLLLLPIPLPKGESSLTEQQKIADCLSSLDDRITAENEKLDTLKTHKKGLMQQLFPAQGETLPKLRFPEFRDTGVWEVKELSQVCQINPSVNNLPETFVYIDLESVDSGNLHQKKVISREGAPSRAQRLLKRHDVIFQMVRPYQRNNYYFDANDNISYVASTGYAQLRAHDSSLYLFQYLHNDNFVDRVLAKCTGSNYPAINSSDLSKILVEIPNLSEQQKIADCLSSIDDRVTAENEKLDTLKTHKKGLMQQLFPAQGQTLPKKKLEDIAPLQHRTIMTEQNHKQLGTTLWGIADQLRGAMNADDFRDYMLSFLFLRYLSDNYEAAAQKELGSDYPDNNILGLTENSKTTPLQLWYDQNPDDIKEFEKQMRRKAHYVIKPQHLWGNIAEMARTQNKKLLETLQEGLKYIENESFDSNFQGLFSEINLNSEKLGKTLPDRNAKLCTIITAIAEGLNNFSTDSDTLGDAYEYLIGQFASGSGKKAGEFYTPQQISSILSAVVTLDSQDPSTGKKKHLDSVLDFACGSGSLLLNVRHQLGLQGISKIYGQEKNITTYNLARMNMLLHGVKDSEFEIFHGDTLINQWEMLKEANPAKKPSFDAVVANPPFSYRWEPTEAMSNDVRFKNYGLAPKSAADFAFLLHGFHYLKPEGTMAIVLPHGVLFRGGAEEKIRTKLLKDDNIDTVIGLPANLFYSTGIPVCILVLKKCKKPDDVLFINAAEYFEKGKRQNRLLPEHISKIIDTYQFRRSEERYSRIVPMTEIESNGYNLNISRYISTAMSEEEIDLDAVHSTLLEVEKKIDASTKRHNQFLKELGLPPLP